MPKYEIVDKLPCCQCGREKWYKWIEVDAHGKTWRHVK